MKTETITALVLLSFVLAPEPALAQRARRNPPSAPPPAAPTGPEEPPRRYPRDTPFRVEHEKLDLDVDLEKEVIAGTATLVLERSAGAGREVELDAVDLDVTEVREVLAPAPLSLRFRATGEKLVIELPETPPANPLTLEIAYRLAHPKNGLHFFKPAPDAPDVPYQLWSQGESEESRFWFPCVDTPEMRSTSEMIVHAPKGFEVLSNGKEVEEPRDEPGGKTRWHWREGLPHPAYLTTLVVGKFAVAKEDWHGTPVVSYVPPAHAADAARSFENTRAMLDYFSERFGVRYPYEQYAQVCVEQFIHGGMENMSATTLTDRTLHDERAHLDSDSDGLVAHELAHQWWGDLLTCRDWAHIWLNEGFASYFEACWDEKKNGEDAYDYNMLEKAGGALDGGRSTPLVRRRYRDADECFGGGTYPKGAWVLHMLRRKLGEEAFWRGLQAYANEHKGEAVETDDFRRSMERATSRSLGGFFWQWTERAGHPVLDVRVGWDEKERLLEIEARETQEGEPFDFEVEIEVALADDPANPALHDAWRMFPMRIEKKEERLFVPLAARPRWVRFDAREAVLKEVTLHEERDQLFAMLADAPRAIARIEAARALAKDPGEKVVAKLGEALLREPFWGAAAELARLLGGIPGERARDALIAGLEVKEPRARRAVVSALGSFRGDAKVASALLALAKKGEPSLHVEAEIGSALARIGDPRAFEVLSAMLEKPSSQETLRTTALRGLAELPDLRGLPLARARIARANLRDVRAAAIEAVGRLAGRKECDAETRRAAAAEVAAVLEETSPGLRLHAIGALREMSAEASLPALEALARHDPREHIRQSARDAAEKIRAGTPPDAEVARLREDLKKYAEANRALEERLERLEARGQEVKGGGASAPVGGPK